MKKIQTLGPFRRIQNHDTILPVTINELILNDAMPVSGCAAALVVIWFLLSRLNSARRSIINICTYSVYVVL